MRKILQNPSHRTALILVFYAALGSLLYMGCLAKYFAMEDFFHIGWVERGGFRGVVSAFYSDNEYGLYRPLTIHVYFYLCRLVFGLNPVGYHLVNMVSHIANTMLVFLLVYTLTEDRWTGFVSGVIYMTRIAHFLGVFWISGIQEVWLASFYLLTLLLFVQFSRTGKRLSYFAAVCGFLLSLTCKENAFTLPFVLLAYGLLFDEQLHVRTLLRRYGIFFVIMFIFVMAKLFLLALPIGRLYELGVGVWLFRNLFAYMIWQVNLTHLAFICLQVFAEINPYKFLLRDNVVWLISGALAVLLIGMLVILRDRIQGIASLRKRDTLTRLAAFGILFFLLSLSPALLLKHRVQQFYLFVPSVGFSIVAASIVCKYLKERTTGVLLVFIVLTALLGYTLIDRIPDGRTSASARAFLQDLNEIIKGREHLRAVYVENSDTFVYQVLWYGEAFNTFLDKPVPVIFDFEDPDFRGGEDILRVSYDGEHLHEITEL